MLPAYSFVPPGTANYGEPAYADFKGMPYGEAVEKAKALMADAGYGPDNPLKIKLRYNNAEDHKRIAVAVQAMWKQIGVQTGIGSASGRERVVQYGSIREDAVSVKKRREALH